MIKLNKKHHSFKTRMLRYDFEYRNYLEAWQNSGYKLTTYECPHCEQIIDTAKPNKEHVASKGFWDSMHTCPLCGKMEFIKVYPSGKVTIMMVQKKATLCKKF